MRILFLSDQDQCRGPMARAIAERMARTEHLEGVVFDSAGIAAPQAQPPTLEAASFMKGEKYNIIPHRSKRLSPPLADGADLIFGMTQAQVNEARRALGPDYAPKVVLLNAAVDLATSKMDVPPPDNGSIAGYRRIYAALCAAIGRLIRMLEDPQAVPEHFGAQAMPKKMKPGTGGNGPRATESTVDPEKRVFLANLLFHLIERAFEPPTLGSLLEELSSAGHSLSRLELEELLRQDLHNLVRIDKDGAWYVIHGAAEKRRQEARAEAKARSDAERARREAERQKEADRNMTEEIALEILGVTRETTVGDARRKYRALLKRYHPDKFHDDVEFRDMAEQKARRINAAWDMMETRLPEGGGADESD